MVGRTCLGLRYFAQSHRCVCGRPELELDLQSYEFSVFVEDGWFNAQQFVFVALRKRDIGIGIADYGPGQILWLVKDLPV